MDKPNGNGLYLKMSNIMWEMNGANKYVLKVLVICLLGLPRGKEGSRDRQR